MPGERDARLGTTLHMPSRPKAQNRLPRLSNGQERGISESLSKVLDIHIPEGEFVPLVDIVM